MLAEKLPEIETVPKIMVHYINMVRPLLVVAEISQKAEGVCRVQG